MCLATQARSVRLSTYRYISRRHSDATAIINLREMSQEGGGATMQCSHVHHGRYLRLTAEGVKHYTYEKKNTCSAHGRSEYRY